jgi:hypothetical protein
VEHKLSILTAELHAPSLISTHDQSDSLLRKLRSHALVVAGGQPFSQAFAALTANGAATANSGKTAADSSTSANNINPLLDTSLNLTAQLPECVQARAKVIAEEIARYCGVETHSTSAFIGGIVSQEVWSETPRICQILLHLKRVLMTQCIYYLDKAIFNHLCISTTIKAIHVFLRP